MVARLMSALPRGSNSRLFRSPTLRKGDHLFHSGDRLDVLHMVKSGAVKTYMTSRKGKEHVVTFYMPGDVVGVDALARGVHESSGVALETSALCTAPVARLEKLVPRFSPDWLFRLAAEEVMREHRSVLVLGKRSAQARLAAFLITISERYEARGYSPREFSLSMPRRDIGSYLGMSIETVSRTLARMQDDGLLQVSRRRVTIRDSANLNALADIQPWHAVGING